MTTSQDITHLFTDRIFRETSFSKFKRTWLLFLRWWYQWRITRHQLNEGRCWTGRRQVLQELSEMDEMGKGLW